MPMHTGGLMLFRYPEGAHEEWLHETLSSNDDPEDVQYPFNQKLVWPLRRLGLPHWVKDHNLDPHYHVRHSALPKPGRFLEMFRLVSRLHATRLHRDRPLWEAHIIEGVEGNQFALYVKTHHSMIDGVGSMRMLRACLSSDADQTGMPAPWNLERARNNHARKTDLKAAAGATADATPPASEDAERTLSQSELDARKHRRRVDPVESELGPTVGLISREEVHPHVVDDVREVVSGDVGVQYAE